MANGVEEAVKEAEAKNDSGITINIEGPVIIAGDSNQDMLSLIQHLNPYNHSPGVMSH